jgi:hypothetical protein
MKKFKQWVLGLLMMWWSTMLFFAIIILPAEIFVELMNRTGLAFIAPFIMFMILMLFFIVMPYGYIVIMKDSFKKILDKENEEKN